MFKGLHFVSAKEIRYLIYNLFFNIYINSAFNDWKCSYVIKI